jgi:hypothetical protein
MVISITEGLHTMTKFRTFMRDRAIDGLWRNIDLIGCLTEDEMFNGTSAMRARRAPEPKERLYVGDVDSTKRFCMEVHRNINGSRIARNCEPLPGNGWNEWDKGTEFVPYNERQLINCKGQKK